MIKPSKQYLAVRKEILSHFESAKDKASAHKVQMYHGCFVEEKIREWLQSFLPKKYGVCAGYIVSQKLSKEQKHPHFDIIIYDSINSPTLWVEDLSHNASQSRAIPAEYVLAVFESKSTLDTTTIGEALEHINELENISKKVDSQNERYRKYLPSNFFWGMIFIEVEPDTHSSKTICDKILTQTKVRGYFSSFIFRKRTQTFDQPESGTMNLCVSDTKFDDFGNIDTMGIYGSEKKNRNNQYLGVISTWTLMEFIRFEFDILAKLNGTYRTGFVSSWYGMELPKDK